MIDISRAMAIEGWMSEGELTWLAEQAQTRHTIIEIGSWCGRSTRALADHCPGMVYAIDLWAGTDGPERYGHFSQEPVTRERAIFNDALADHIKSGKIVPIRMDSVTLRRGLGQAYVALPKYVDMLFLDSRHDYVTIFQELNIWATKLCQDGLLCGHDYGHPNLPDVKLAVDALVGPVNTYELIWWKA